MVETKFEITDSVNSFLNEHKNHPSVASVKIEVDEDDGEKYGHVSDELVAELNRTEKLFTSEEYAQERIDGATETVKKAVESILKEIGKKSLDHKVKKAVSLLEVTASSRFFDSYVGSDAASITVSLRGLGEADDLIDDRDIEHEALYVRGAHECLGSAMESWDWAAWLGDEKSPFYSHDFVEAYAKDQASLALEQFSQTLNESSFEDDVKKDLAIRIKDLAADL